MWKNILNNSNNPRGNWYQLLVINGTNRGKLSFKLLLLDKITFFCDNVSILWPCIPAVIEKKVWTAMLIRAWCWLPQYSEFWCSASETEVGTECPSVECVCAALDVTFTSRSWSIFDINNINIETQHLGKAYWKCHPFHPLFINL